LFEKEKRKKMNRPFSKWFIRLNWISLVLIFLVTIAGSFVRISGSGMGCPDWPKCFGQWVPPTDEAVLPADYKVVYSTKRAKKIEKFSKLLDAIGFKTEAKKIREDKSLLYEQDFNAQKTWTEYVNRLVGFLAGNAILLIFLWVLVRYRQRKLVFLATINLIFLMFQAWFGSIVVATNLVPWTITVHLFFAIVIIAIQVIILLQVSPSQQIKLHLSTPMRWIVGITFLITFIQMFLGTQVRESIDLLTMQGYGRDSWTDKLGMPFYIHRSFSWLVLIMLTVLAWLNFKGPQKRLIYMAFIVLAIELTSGVLLAYADMPGLVQTSHLIFATWLLTILLLATLRMRKLTVN
jgi:cytochrome c oxidase assembly protein subunit 15